MRPEPPINELAECVHCDPETGRLTWKRLASRTKTWNALFPGKPAFATLSERGYLVGGYKLRQLKAHRVVWALTHGYWPGIIDHINGDRTDNRITNLREVTVAENAQNSKIQRRNSTGIAGVSWNSEQRKYRAEIQANGKRHYLGVFASLEDASMARKEAERRLGYHPNHGRAA